MPPPDTAISAFEGLTNAAVFTIWVPWVGCFRPFLQEIGKAIQNAEEDITSEETKIQQGKGPPSDGPRRVAPGCSESQAHGMYICSDRQHRNGTKIGLQQRPGAWSRY